MRLPASLIPRAAGGSADLAWGGGRFPEEGHRLHLLMKNDRALLSQSGSLISVCMTMTGHLTSGRPRVLVASVLGSGTLPGRLSGSELQEGRQVPLTDPRLVASGFALCPETSSHLKSCCEDVLWPGWLCPLCVCWCLRASSTTKVGPCTAGDRPQPNWLLLAASSMVAF